MTNELPRRFEKRARGNSTRNIANLLKWATRRAGGRRTQAFGGTWFSSSWSTPCSAFCSPKWECCPNHIHSPPVTNTNLVTLSYSTCDAKLTFPSSRNSKPIIFDISVAPNCPFSPVSFSPVKVLPVLQNLMWPSPKDNIYDTFFVRKL